MALHSASIMGIPQPVYYVKNVLFNDPIPCPVDPTQLQFDGAKISATQQIGLGGQQWANYYVTLNGNITSRLYPKENVVQIHGLLRDQVLLPIPAFIPFRVLLVLIWSELSPMLLFKLTL
jgi:hypothetical protein